MIAAVGAWLLTYLVHSTLLIALAALVSIRVSSNGWRDMLWKVALVGGIVTATVQMALGLEPVAGQHQLPGNVTAETEWGVGSGELVVRAEPDRQVPDRIAPASGPASEPVNATTSSASSVQAPVITEPAAATESGSQTWSMPSARSTLLGIWAGIALLLLVRLAYRHVRLLRMLGDRRQVVESGLPEMLAELRRNTGIWRPVWLAASPSCPSPLALGASEICVPERFLDELGRDEQRAALAHELAHIARRDPLWHLIAGIVESVLFIQPLNALVRLRMREAAEHLCDDWAVHHVGSEVGLARCLATVASWVSPNVEPIPVGVMAMAEGGSPLLVRVQRLLDHRSEALGVSGVTRGLVAALLLITLAGAAPAVVARAPQQAAEEPRLGAANILPGMQAESIATPSASTTPNALPAQLPAAVSGEESTGVTRVPTNQPIRDQWKWATETAATRGQKSYWIAWVVPSVVTEKLTMIADSRGLNISELDRELSGKPFAARYGFADEVWNAANASASGQRSVAVILFQLRKPLVAAPRVERIVARSVDLPVRLDGPIYWLGAPDVGDSRRWLGDLFDSLDSGLHEALIETVAAHRDTGVVAFLREVIRDDRAEHVHLEAIEGLSWHPTDIALKALIETAQKGATTDMRREAAEAIGDMQHPGATEALRKLITSDDVADVRGEMVEALGDRADGSMLHTLVTIAETDGDMRVRKQAVEALAKLPSRYAVDGLEMILWNSDNTEIQAEAAESLGDVGTREAFIMLTRVIDRHPSVRVAVEAVEALAQLDEWGPERLATIARTHPNAMVRAKAKEELDDLSGSRNRRTVTPDTSSGNVDPGNFNPGNVDPGNFNAGTSSPPKSGKP